MPSAVTATVSALQMEEDKAEDVEAAGATENVLLTVHRRALRKDRVYAGCVVCAAEDELALRLCAEKVVVHVLAVPGHDVLAKEYDGIRMQRTGRITGE